MLPKNLHIERITNAFRYALMLAFLFYFVPAHAQDATVTVPDAGSMLKNIAAQVPALTQLLTAIAYVLGFYFVISGVIRFKHLGESRTMMSQEHSVKGPLIYVMIGAMLIYIPTSVQVGLSTFWTNPNPYGYTQEQNQWSDFINVCFVIIQFIGAIAFIRGLIMLSHLGDHSVSPGTFGKGLTYIIAGILCINIYQFVQVIFVTLGIGIQLS